MQDRDMAFDTPTYPHLNVLLRGFFGKGPKYIRQISPKSSISYSLTNIYTYIFIAMALISEIRKKSWLLIVLLAMALGGFVVMDMVRAGSKSKGRDFVLGSVNGEKLDWQEFQKAERILYPNSTGDVFGQRNYIWNFMVEDKLVREQADDMGYNVGDEELEDLQYGQHLSPVVQRNFRDPNTGQINRQNLEQIKANLGTGKLQPQLEEFWAFQKNEIIKDRLESKLSGLLKKCMYTPTWIAQQ
jgi:peptidyl-prolyl cis-trans isomerase D